MGHLIIRQQISCKRGHIENILELTMLDFNGTSSCYWDLRVITHMNSRPSCGVKSGKGILGSNHVVGCYGINQLSFRLREAIFQGMAPLMIFCQFSNIVILFSLCKEFFFCLRSVDNCSMVFFMHWLSE